MRGLFSQPHGDDVEFELFSNIVLKFTAILIVVMVLLALNVGQKLDSIISPNSFSGGSERPVIYIDAYDIRGSSEKKVQDDFSGLAIALRSRSDAETAQTVKDGKTVAINPGDTFAGSANGGPDYMLSILSCIDPGSFKVEGDETALVVPKGTNKTGTVGHDEPLSVSPSIELASRVITLWNKIFRKPTFPNRAFSEFNQARTRVYIETTTRGGKKKIVLGDVALDFETAMRLRVFDFLTSLSSGNTEIVYLGEIEAHPELRTDSRISFFETHNFLKAADAYRKVSYPGQAELAESKSVGFEPDLEWNTAPTDLREGYLSAYQGDEPAAKQAFDRTQIWLAYKSARSKKIADRIFAGQEPGPGELPPLIEYADAWKAYIDYRLSLRPIPPKWFIEEFLAPLGFDKRVVLLDQ